MKKKFDLRPLFAIALALAASVDACAKTDRAIDDDQLPTRYSPVANEPATGYEMRTGAATYVETEPWALPRLAYKTGMLATRSLDADYMSIDSVTEKNRYFQKHTLRSVLRIEDDGERQRQINLLSPAEKYDLVIGDLDRAFSTAIWEDVLRKSAGGEIPAWYGLCDGSSAASVLFQEPGHAVTVPSRLPGVSVQFEIGDLKALLAYSMTTYVAQDLPIVGRRCRFEHPDPAKNECFGINPGTLHQLLMQMSANPEKFPYMIVDRSPNAAIWNSALLSASFAYYHPQTNRAVSNRAEDHLIDVSTYNAPAGSPGWAPGTRFLLFTVTTLRMADTRTAADFRSSGKMKPLDMQINYVLELNGKLEILGGEWLTPGHPNFIWALPRDYRPQAKGDRATAGIAWNGLAIPDAAMPLVLDSSRAGQPLFRVIDFIYRQSLR